MLDQQEHNQGSNSGSMHGSQGGGGRKFNDQSDTHNRRTYDMMNQNSGNQVSHQFLLQKTNYLMHLIFIMLKSSYKKNDSKCSKNLKRLI